MREEDAEEKKISGRARLFIGGAAPETTPKLPENYPLQLENFELVNTLNTAVASWFYFS